MVNRKFRIAAVAAFGLPMALLISGCSLCKASGTQVSYRPFKTEPKPVTTVANLLPPDAEPGECFVRVYVPPRFETVQESVCVREASERLEVVPAQYEWVEERVMVKDASTILEEVPAEFQIQERQVLVDPGYTGWKVEKTANCNERVPPTADDDMLCLVSHKPVYDTVTTEVMVRPATCREVTIPAEYQTVRRQKLVAPATTRRIPIPAEFATVQKTRMVADATVEWRRVNCELEQTADYGEFGPDREIRRVGFPEDGRMIDHNQRQLDPIDDRRLDDLHDRRLDDLDDEPIDNDHGVDDPPVDYPGDRVPN